MCQWSKHWWETKFFWNRMGATPLYICPEVFNVLPKIGDSRFAVFWTMLVLPLYKWLIWIPHETSFQINTKKVSFHVFLYLNEMLIFHIEISVCIITAMLGDFCLTYLCKPTFLALSVTLDLFHQVFLSFFPVGKLKSSVIRELVVSKFESLFRTRVTDNLLNCY